MNKIVILLTSLMLVGWLPCLLYAGNETGTTASGQGQVKQQGIAVQLKNDRQLQLTLESVVEYLLSNNYDVKKALLEYRGVTTDLMSFQSRYDPTIIGNGEYSYEVNPNKNTTIFQGSSTEVTSLYAGIAKKFSTGTTISGGLTTYYQNVRGAGLPGYDIGGKGYQSSIKIELSQELMKNCIGVIDRYSEQQLANSEWMRKQGVRMKLAALLVDAIIGYWNIAIADESLKTSELSLNSTRDIRNLVADKMRLGLTEREDILEWEGRVIEGTNTVDRAEKSLFDARLAVLRTLNLDSDLDIIIGKTFQTDAPSVTFEEAVKDAFLKRIDWNNQKVTIQNAELEYKIASNNQLPSLKLKGSIGNKDYDDSSWGSSFDGFNEEYAVGVEFAYPLGDRAGSARMRKARLNLKEQQVELQNLEKQVREEVLSIVRECDVSYKVFVQTKQSTDYKKRYYEQVILKFRRGRYSALKVKMALDDYIIARRTELQSLVNYNIALIRRDLARNVVFENFNIDIDAILKRVEN